MIDKALARARGSSNRVVSRIVAVEDARQNMTHLSFDRPAVFRGSPPQPVLHVVVDLTNGHASHDKAPMIALQSFNSKAV